MPRVAWQTKNYRVVVSDDETVRVEQVKVDAMGEESWRVVPVCPPWCDEVRFALAEIAESLSGGEGKMPGKDLA